MANNGCRGCVGCLVLLMLAGACLRACGEGVASPPPSIEEMGVATGKEIGAAG